MTRNILVLILTFFIGIVFGQKVELKGVVKDNTGEPVAFASIKSNTSLVGAQTGFDGTYTLKLEKGEHQLVVEAFGFNKLVETIVLEVDTEKDFTLSEEVNELQEIVITGERPDQNVSKVEMSVETLQMDEVKKLPAFLGEVDVIKTIQLLPGVTTVGEGATGFNVRGGNSDQNLVILDDAPIYSSSHLFGFFSIFNSDAIKDIKLYKGGIPSKYGGRLSSVLAINQEPGNTEKLSGTGGIGLVSSRLTLSGPMKKGSNKGTWQISGRRSYADVFSRLYGKLANDTTLSQNIAYFYDLNGKASYRLNENNKLFFSGYLGRDVFSFGDDFGFNWGNATATLKWNHTYSDSLFSNISLVYTKYDYDVGVPEGENEFKWQSGIRNINLNADYEWLAGPKSTVQFGTQINTYSFNPGSVVPGSGNMTFVEIVLDKERALEPNLYVSHEYKLNDKVTLQYGLRYSSYYKIGAESVNLYSEDIPKSDPAALIGVRNYGSGEIVRQSHGLEPRLGIKYGIDSTSSIKASYNRTRQYVHLVSNTTSSVPFDVWKSTGYHVDPAIADQIAAGYFRNFEENTYETSVEVYYKWMQDLLDYRDGAELLLNEQLESELLSGRGRAYGAEFMVRKKKGDLTGWFSYTWAKTERQIDGEFLEDKINNGEWYPSNYDKRHDLSLALTYEINKRWSVSTNFSFAQGRPITLSDGRFVYNGQSYFNYADRNQSRIPNYHRLDLSATLQGKKNDQRRWKSSWVFSVYNVYGRRNAYSVYTRTDDNGQSQDYQLSILGSFLPSATYNFEF